jgi:hypothetical protein
MNRRVVGCAVAWRPVTQGVLLRATDRAGEPRCLVGIPAIGSFMNPTAE